jgi:ADP-ribose pyrophosphatase YjhB (NUDIX family)
MEKPIMKYTGAGFILFSPDFRVLLVQDAKTKKWGFSKGHREDSDLSDLHTAERELFEETGIPPTAYTVYDHPFRIIRGSSSYIFRYAVLHQNYPATIQCSKEIGGIQWASIYSFFLQPTWDANKYLRTWTDDIVTQAQRKTYTLLQSLVYAHTTATSVTPVLTV